MKHRMLVFLVLAACSSFSARGIAEPPPKSAERSWLGAEAERRLFGAPGVTRYGGRLEWDYDWLDWGMDAAGESAPATTARGVVAACAGHVGHSWFRLKSPSSMLLLHSRARAGALGLKPGEKTRLSRLPLLSPYVGFSTLLRLALNVQPGLRLTVDNELSLRRPFGGNDARAAVDRLFFGSAVTFAPGVPFL